MPCGRGVAGLWAKPNCIKSKNKPKVRLMQTRNARVFEARDLSGAIVGVLHLLDSGECVIHGKIPSGAMLTEALAESNQSRFGWEVERMPSGMRRLTVQDGHAFASIVLTEQSAEQLRDAL